MSLILIALFAMIVISLFYFAKLRREIRHDKGLYPLCETRREMYRFLNTNVDTISKEDYNYLKLIMRQVDTVIHEYKELSVNAFRLKKLASLMKTVLSLKKNQIDKAQLREPENEELKQLSKRFYEQFLFCFFVHTPFLLVQRFIFAFCMVFYVVNKRAELHKTKDNKSKKPSEGMQSAYVFVDYYENSKELKQQYKDGSLCTAKVCQM